jgi:hypothetical protein
MCEQAETFCRKTWTGLVQVVHLKVRVRAGLDIVISLVCSCYVVGGAPQRASGKAQEADFITRLAAWRRCRCACARMIALTVLIACDCCRLRVWRRLIKMGRSIDD